MSKWDSFAGGTKKVKVSNGGLFAPASDTYRTIESSNNAIDAAVKASKEIKRNFQMCDRLPKQPLFNTNEGEIDVKGGVMGAIGDIAADLLDLEQAPELTSAANFGISGGSSSSDTEDD